MRYIYSLALGAFLFGSVSAQAGSPRGDNFFGGIYIGTPFIAHDETGNFSADANSYDTESKAGYEVGGSFGGWINTAQRMEISIGYRAYESKIKIKAAGKDPITGNVLRATATPPAVVGDATEPGLALISDGITAAATSIGRRATTLATATADVTRLTALTSPTVAEATELAVAEGTVMGVTALNTVDAAVVTSLRALEENGADIDVDISVIPIMFNNYFYPLYLWDDAVPALAQNLYFGFGVGVGLTDYSADSILKFEDSYKKVSLLVQASLGYEFYLSDLKEFGVSIPNMLDGMSMGVNYQFTWSSSKPKGSFVGTAGTGGTDIPFSNERLEQKSHALFVTARYDF